MSITLLPRRLPAFSVFFLTSFLARDPTVWQMRWARIQAKCGSLLSGILAHASALHGARTDSIAGQLCAEDSEWPTAALTISPSQTRATILRSKPVTESAAALPVHHSLTAKSPSIWAPAI